MNLSIINYKNIRFLAASCFACGLGLLASAASAETMGALSSYAQVGRSLVATAQTGQKLRITPYGGGMLRIQVAAPAQQFLADDHYRMVESHGWQGSLKIANQDKILHLAIAATEDDTGLFVEIDKNTMQLSFGSDNALGKQGTAGRDEKIFLREKSATDWSGSLITQQFALDNSEHFTGLGHGYYGRVDSLDLRGQELERNYQRDKEQQAPLVVPFYISSKGYGVFLNSSFRNKFRFGAGDHYSFSIDTGGYAEQGQMDYFVIAGPAIKDVLRRYIALTGHPRLPSKAMFGLALSDKGDFKTSDGDWWKNKIQQHRAAGFPLDHIVNDNRWRASGGERCKSEFAWDHERYPSPKKFSDWASAEHLAITLDFNRCIAPLSQGYDKAAYNIANSEGMDFSDAAPDLTNAKVRQWWWNLMYNRGIKPLGKTADVGLWIDEFDQMGPAPDEQILSNGRSFAEMRNYWFMLIGQGLAEEGWDKNIGEAKRPFIWVRGNTAGAQRYSTLWSGDIQPTYSEMKQQIRGMQAAGLSGFPFWGHDAGGFDASGVEDFDTLYRQWSLAMGIFSPFWKPHGIGPSRWPLDRSPAAQAEFLRYSQLRYQLMPYTYTYAHRAAETGEPIARPMLFNYPQYQQAWQRDLQYLWGDQLLVAPNTSAPTPANNKLSIWLPPGAGWYDFWNDNKLVGGQDIVSALTTGQLPLFVAAGSVLPMALPALSIGDSRKDVLEIHIYTGADGKFVLYEDDEVSEKYQRKAYSLQEYRYDDSRQALEILPVKGSYQGAIKARRYKIVFHGLPEGKCGRINGQDLPQLQAAAAARFPSTAAESGWFWLEDSKHLVVQTPLQKLNAGMTITSHGITDCQRSTIIK